MSTITKMEISKEFQFKTNALKTHITIETVHGSLTKSVIDIRESLQNPYLLPEVRRMFQMMMDFYNKEKIQ